MMAEQVPWKGNTVNNWLRNTIASVVDEFDHDIILSVLTLLYLNDNKSQLSSLLCQLLGSKSFSGFSRIIQFREQILEAFTYENQNAHDAITNSEFRMSICHPSQEYNISKFRNYLRYDVSKSDIKASIIDLIPIDQLPVWAQSSFDELSFLNAVQSSVFKTAFTTNENLLVCAPTGTGKTNIALLTILHEIEKYLLSNPYRIGSSEFLVVYISPIKALATEITNKLKNSLKSLKICVNEYTGDTSLSFLETSHSHILIATPEKWDVTTRKFEGSSIGSRLSLLIIDEIHFLQDDRGPVIEAIVARTLRQVQQSHQSIRIVGLSATLPNFQDVASFLQVPPSGLFFFGPEYRPVPLGISLLGSLNVSVLPVSDIYHQIFQLNAQIFNSKDKAQIDIVCLELLEKLIPRQQSILIFVHSRNETTRFAQLIETCFSASISKNFHEQVQNRQLHPDLQSCLKCGIGIHHAGLSREDRNFVENIFSNGSLQILVCTSTLAWGVNLPAHTVIIRGT
jgi:replicative superfamily II helicase